ncbi:MAG: hypothetical protein ACRC2K_07915, partial [Clostridium sp.]
MFDGWIKLYRRIFKSRVWKESNPTEKVVLITLLLLARFKENEGFFRGKTVVLTPGDMIIDVDFLLELCGRGVTYR